jgi:hypothetical protein
MRSHDAGGMARKYFVALELVAKLTGTTQS